jgi:hypothetical protein
VYAQKAERGRGTPCLFDFERGEVPNCVFTRPDRTRFVSAQYLRSLSFDSGGLATVRVDDGWMYVDRYGKALITGVPTFDNGPDYFNDGLVRFVKDGKYGFANRTGRVVIQPIYDGAMPFEKGKAKVCKGCFIRTAGDYQFFSGGQWFLLDTRGGSTRIAEKTE